MTRFITSLILLATALAALAGDAPRYIFYYIGDGMGLQPLMAAQAYNRDVRHNPDPLLMFRLPVGSFCMTYSASDPITDSAAAGTALSTGSKTRNGMLGMNPDTAGVTSVAAQLQKLGYGIGVVTSVAPDDATPGAFYAHVPSRKMYYDIDMQAARCGYQFIAGAGLRGTVGSDGKPTDVLKTMNDNGVQIVYGPDGIKDIAAERVVLLNPKGTPEWNIGYTIDSIPGVLTLPLIASTCLEHLERTSPERFFMMVEGGNIDHALHANDAGAAIKEIINFDEALAVAYDFYLAHPDETLIVVTADHDTGGMSHVHSRTRQPNPLGVFDYQRVSKEAFSDYCKSLLNAEEGTYGWDDMRAYLEKNLGLFSHIPVSEEATAALRDKFDETFRQRHSADQKTLYASFNAFAVAVFDLINNAAGTIFTTTSHSGNPVPVIAVGVGAERFAGARNNIDIPAAIRAIAGIE